MPHEVLMYADFTVAGEPYIAYARIRIPDLTHGEIVAGQCDLWRYLVERMKKHGYVPGVETWIVSKVVLKNNPDDAAWEALVDPLPENQRMICRIEKGGK